jgi:hypothetical protein
MTLSARLVFRNRLWHPGFSISCRLAYVLQLRIVFSAFAVVSYVGACCEAYAHGHYLTRYHIASWPVEIRLTHYPAGMGYVEPGTLGLGTGYLRRSRAVPDILNSGRLAITPGLSATLTLGLFQGWP